MQRWAAAAVLLLAGCGGGGGGGGGGSGIDPRLGRLDIYEAQRVRVLGDPGAGVMGMSPTLESELPTTGTAQYNGFASLRVETLPDTSVLAGDAQLETAFDTGTLTGTLDNFFGTDAEGILRDYGGSIAVTDGVLGASGPTEWSATYAGALTGGGQVLALDGTLAGQFLGDAAQAITGSDLEAEIAVGTSQTTGVLIVVGEQ